MVVVAVTRSAAGHLQMRCMPASIDRAARLAGAAVGQRSQADEYGGCERDCSSIPSDLRGNGLRPTQPRSVQLVIPTQQHANAYSHPTTEAASPRFPSRPPPAGGGRVLGRLRNRARMSGSSELRYTHSLREPSNVSAKLTSCGRNRSRRHVLLAVFFRIPRPVGGQPWPSSARSRIVEH